MKEATGELNMTVITIIAIAAVGALFYIFLWPIIQRSLVRQTCRTYGQDWIAEQLEVVDDSTNARVARWMCCPPNRQGDDECVRADAIE